MQEQKYSGGYPKDSICNKDHPDYNKPGFLVRATQKGYYGVAQREPGDVFRITHARHFADAGDPKLAPHGWMVKVEGQPKLKRGQAQDQGPRGARPAPADPSERQRKMDKMDHITEEASEEDASKEADVI